jgi:C4-dicarboxylate-specific signal transduction histidine kinase
VSNDLKQSLRLAAAGEMAAALAHELNQPLTALSAYGKACEFLVERGDNGELLKTTVQRMIAESGRAAEVVRRLRDFFRTGAMKLEAVEAGQLVSSVSQQFFTQLRQQGVLLEVAEMPALAMLADRLQIELVLRNLLANALDAVQEQPEGQRRIAVSAQLLDSKKHGKGSCLQLSVEDSGKGVSADLLTRLFEPFVSSKATGLGLGLVLSRAIMEAHGGSLWAEVGDHGIFKMALPLARHAVEGQENYVAA